VTAGVGGAEACPATEPDRPTEVAFRITVPAAHEDAAVGVLWELGTQGIEVRRGPQGSSVLLAYFLDRPVLAAAIRDGLAAAAPGSRQEPVEIPKVDWVKRYREGFVAFPVGRFLCAPAWDVPSDIGDPARLLVVEPGRAFGTGTHESTRLCLEWLESLIPETPPRRVLDIGTGTGILAIAALRLGAHCAIGTDVDPEALCSARRHCQLNAAAVRLVRADGGRPFPPHRFDLVMANLTAPLLCERREETVALCAPGGQLLLSGLLVEDLQAVRRSYSGLGPIRTRTSGEWAALLLQAA